MLYTLVETAKLHTVDPAKYCSKPCTAERGETLFPQMPSAA